MEVEEWAKAAASGALTVAKAFRLRDTAGVHDREEAGRRWRDRARTMGDATFMVKDIVPRRNLVIVSWEWTHPDGSRLASGTWFLSLDRDEDVVECTELFAEP